MRRGLTLVDGRGCLLRAINATFFFDWLILQDLEELSLEIEVDLAKTGHSLGFLSFDGQIDRSLLYSFFKRCFVLEFCQWNRLGNIDQ